MSASSVLPLVSASNAKRHQRTDARHVPECTEPWNPTLATAQDVDNGHVAVLQECRKSEWLCFVIDRRCLNSAREDVGEWEDFIDPFPPCWELTDSLTAIPGLHACTYMGACAFSYM